MNDLAKVKKINRRKALMRIDSVCDLIRNVRKCARLIRICDRMVKDSKQKRSIKWPGRATSWEIRQVLGYPPTAPIPKEFVGKVNEDGSVTVNNQLHPKQSKTLSRAELDRRLAFERMSKAGNPSGNFGLNGLSASSINTANSAQNIQNQKSLAESLHTLANVVTLIATTVTTLGAIKNGTQQLVGAAKSAGSWLKGVGQGISNRIRGLNTEKNKLQAVNA